MNKEIENPEGYEARIEGNKVIIEQKDIEDERIRKILIESFEKANCSKVDEFVNCKLNKGEILAYLEKQKDASNDIEEVNRIDKYIDENTANAHDMNDSNPDKKYYFGWDDALCKMAGILQDVYSGEKQKEQKPAEWSEEDDNHRKDAILAIQEYRSECIKKYGKDPAWADCVDWLKSIGPQLT